MATDPSAAPLASGDEPFGCPDAASAGNIYDVILATAKEGVMVTDPAGTILMVNLAFCRVTGYQAAEVVGKTPRVLHSGRQDQGFYEAMWRTVGETGRWEGEIWNRRKDGVVYPEWLTISEVKDGGGRVLSYVGVFTDITVHKAAEERLAFLAYHDPLTGLPNRANLQQALSKAIAHAARHGDSVAVLFIDLDGFKLVNDTLGHDAGDELLKQVKDRLLAHVRREDTVARLGGDEFVVVLAETAGERSPAVVAKKLLDALQLPFVIDGREAYVSACVGISLYPSDGNTPETLLRNADVAMYRAKRDGRNRHRFFTAAMDRRLRQQLAMETELRRALDRSEMVLYYQPLVDTQTGRLAGAEALMRWNHPSRGLVLPEQFVPLAEETGLIVPLGEWALETACSQASSWRTLAAGGVRVAVNLSARQLAPGPHRSLTSVLDRPGAHGELLEVEVTEGVLMESLARGARTLAKLKERGLRVSVDDFGVGYSSLSYLRRLPLDTLKIDKSFVRDVCHDQDAAAIVTAIATMAEGLRLEVTAEGVETADQLAFLRSLPCHRVQGYYYGRAVSPAQFERDATGLGWAPFPLHGGMERLM